MSLRNPLSPKDSSGLDSPLSPTLTTIHLPPPPTTWPKGLDHDLDSLHRLKFLTSSKISGRSPARRRPPRSRLSCVPVPISSASPLPLSLPFLSNTSCVPILAPEFSRLRPGDPLFSFLYKLSFLSSPFLSLLLINPLALLPLPSSS